MLAEIAIRDFAVVERLTVAFGPGFNVLTGETGAGKSIIVDALAAALGSRVGVDVVRAGAASARVDAAFDVTGLHAEAAASLAFALDAVGAAAEDGVLVLGREIHAAGRTVSRVNGRVAPLSALQAIGAALVDIHGQGDHMSLLAPATQLALIDRFGGLSGPRAAFRAGAGRLRSLRSDRDSLEADTRERARRADVLRHQIGEIDAASIQPGEDARIEAERRVLSAADKLTELVDLARADLDESATEALGKVERGLHAAAALDPAADSLALAAATISEQASDLLRELRAYRDRVEADPARLAELGARLDQLARLRAKYGPSLDDVLAFVAQAQAELEAIEGAETRGAELSGAIAALEAELAASGRALSTLRKESADRLSQKVGDQLQYLGFPASAFSVALRQTLDPGGLPIDGACVAFEDSGLDRAEFQLAANPAEPARPLARVASGGELARVMLALKSALGDSDTIPVHVFDEVDVGIGGRTALAVGARLWGLTAGRQVLCVTHLPQVAAFADRHLGVVKLASSAATEIRVADLDARGRTTELANMFGGATEATEIGAAELLARAARVKAGEA